MEQLQDLTLFQTLDGVQLHGSESKGFCKKLKLQLAKQGQRPLIIKTIELDAFDNCPRLSQDPSQFLGLIDVFLFDRPKSYQKSDSIDWLGELVVPASSILDKWRPYFIAGGIGPHNVRQVLQLNAIGIDLASSIESTPGKKDPQKTQIFFERINLQGALKC